MKKPKKFALFLARWQRLCLEAMDSKTLRPKITHNGRENRKLQDLQSQECGAICVWNISEQIQVWAPWSKDQRLSETLFYMCGVAQHVEDTPRQNR